MDYIEYYVKLPAYALSYIHNADASGYEDDDIQAIDRYLKQFYDEAEALGGYVCVGMPEGDERAYFSPSPAFGLPCDVYNITITIFYE